jgi:hypothetical protein
MLCSFYNGEFTPKYPIWVFLSRRTYKLVNGNRPTRPSVACAVGPSVTMSSTDFSFQNVVFFGIYLNFQWQKSLKNQYLPHSESTLLPNKFH